MQRLRPSLSTWLRLSSERRPFLPSAGLHALLRGCVDWSAEGVAQLTVVLYGSQIAHVADARDVDVWCDGPIALVQQWAKRAQAALEPLRLDLAYAPDFGKHPDHEIALRWCASRGASIAGFLPETPPVNYDDVCAAFARSARRSAVELVMHARILALAGQGTADATAAAAARGWLRSCSSGPEESRGVRRLSERQVAARVRAAAPSSAVALRRKRWSDASVLDALDVLLELE